LANPSLFKQGRDKSGGFWLAAIRRMKQLDGFSLSWMGQKFEARAKDTDKLSSTLKIRKGAPRPQMNRIHFAGRRY
jgi:hypothetical protein